jgi:hypothetical protein
VVVLLRSDWSCRQERGGGADLVADRLSVVKVEPRHHPPPLPLCCLPRRLGQSGEDMGFDGVGLELALRAWVHA